MASDDAKIGFLGALAIAIGSSIGGGLWATPVIAGSIGGPIAVLLMVLVAVPVFLAFPTYFTLAKAWPKTAGSYYYTTRMLIPERENLSKMVGWTTAWAGLLMGGFIYLRYMVLGGASFLNAVFPAVPTAVFTALLLTFSFGVVWFGIRVTGLIEILLDVVLLLAVGVIVFGGILNIDLSNLSPAMPNGLLGALPAYAILFTLGGGALDIINFGGEIDDAENSIGGIIATGVVVDILVAAAVILVAVGVVSSAQLSGQTLAFVVGQYMTGSLALLSGIGALVAGLTTNIASVALFDRFFLALIDDNVLPEWMGRENEHGEPVYLLLAMFVVAVGTAFVDVSLGALSASFAFFFVANILLLSLVGFRLPSTFPEIFDVESVANSRLLRPAVVRWTALVTVVIAVLMFLFLALTQPEAFLWYLAILVASVLVFGLRWWQVGDSSRLMSSGVGFRPVQSDGGEQLNRSD